MPVAWPAVLQSPSTSIEVSAFPLTPTREELSATNQLWLKIVLGA